MRIAAVIFNIISFLFILLLLLVFLDWALLPPFQSFIESLLFIVLDILALLGTIFMLKRRKLWWAFTGIPGAFLAASYYIFLFWRGS
ncbi:MAG: hypothetical protein ABID71_06270 [Chloroflexota bacterium]